MHDRDADIRAIREIIARQFDSLCWSAGEEGEWEVFADDFFPGASLYPAARPAREQSVPAFVQRMKGLAGDDLQSFDEEMLGTEIRVFGNVAVASAGCEITENGSQTTRGVEMLLLIRTEEGWKIVAQTWDTEGPEKPFPTDLEV